MRSLACKICEIRNTMIVDSPGAMVLRSCCEATDGVMKVIVAESKRLLAQFIFVAIQRFAVQTQVRPTKRLLHLQQYYCDSLWLAGW